MAIEGSELSALGSVLTAAGEDSPGVGPTAATLAAVYAAGVGAPITDDLMVMLHGNMRFQSPVDSAPLPLLGYWENATGQSTAASGFPSELWSLAVIVGSDTGRRFSVFQMYDPAWDGTFHAINGMSWETERVTFTNDGTNEYRSQNQNPAFASHAWKILDQWAPAAYPQLTTVHGTVSSETSLYNTIDLGLRFIDRMDGFGQTNRELTPQQNGITWQWATNWNAANIAGAANDGVGWGIYSGILGRFNHLQAGVTCRQVTGDPLGDWYWSFFVPDGSGGLLDVADFAKSGVTFKVPVASSASPIMVSYTTGVIDFQTPGLYPLNAPLVAGKQFVAVLGRLIITNRVGVATGGGSFQVSQNGVDLTANGGLGASTWNALSGATAFSQTLNLTNSLLPLDMTTFPAQLHIATGVTGTSVLQGRYELIGWYE